MKSTGWSMQAKWRIQAFVTSVSLVAVTLLLPASVAARAMPHTGAVPAEQVVESDLFLTGEKPVIAGTVNGDVFIVGSDVTIQGNVNGSAFVVAGNLTLSGKVEGNLYAAALELTQPAGGEIGRSLYALALSLITENESLIGRNLTALAMSANLQGATTRATHAIIGPWELFKLLRDNLNRKIAGPAAYQPNPVEGTTVHVAYDTVDRHQAWVPYTKGNNQISARNDWWLSALQSLVTFLFIGGVILWVFPRDFDRWVEQIRSRPLVSAGYGALVLINGYLISGLVLVLLLGMLFGLIYVSLPTLAWTLFWTALGFLLALFSLFLAATAFLSKAVVAYLAGVFILSWVARGALRYRVIPLLLGLLIYVPLASVPYLGFLIGLIMTLLGLGAIWLSRRPALPLAQANVEAASI